MKILLLSIISCLLAIYAVSVTAQTTANRSVSDVIEEVLTQLPAQQLHIYHQLFQSLVETGTEGVTQLVNMMNVSGKGDNSIIAYALSGMAFFASDDQILKNIVEQAFIASLDATDEPEIKAFLIPLLGIIGSDDGVHKLAGYLSDEHLCSSAVSAINSIGGEEASKTLQTTLMNRISLTPESERSIIQALGDVMPVVDGTESLLLTIMNTKDITTKGVVLKALSKTGSKLSLSDLAAAANATGYCVESTGANDAYIRLIKRVYEQGDTKEAMAAAQNLMKNATHAGSSHIRAAVLEILFNNQKDFLKTLRSALKDGDITFRNAALKFASDYADKTIYTDLLKSLPKAKPEVKIDVLNWIGNEAQSPEKKQIIKTIETGIEKTGLQTLMQLLNDSDVGVKQATVRTLGVIGDPSTLPALTDLLKNNDIRILSLLKDVLEAFPSDIFTDLVKCVSQASNEGKIIIMELLSARKANAYFTLVLDQTKSSNPYVVEAAFKILKDVASEKDFIILCGMLETANLSFVAPLQLAISASIASLTPEKQMEMIKNRMLQAGDSKEHLYYPVLSSLGYALP